ncbi:unnamed protein product [Adineta ricciae]|uniref:Phage tail collar domain-containing protein n=1 Tax=Adineta ricciae TaxID=249248 RepID=A0A813NR61_ADIRI|nr:unnamed protein product [Adineta ricciae]CAF1588603.1 unnamed protein product [Adineta ricciae]
MTNRLGVFEQLTNYTLGVLDDILPGGSSVKENIGNVVFNIHHFTQFVFDGHHIYVYSPKKNEENVHEPRKWTFFYVPILQPVQSSLLSPWVSINKLEIRIRLALGTSQVQEAARQAIINQFDDETATKYSRSWVIAPLMLDSLSAYVVAAGSLPVPGVVPFRIDNPNSDIVTLRFVTLTKEAALFVAVGLLVGDLDIEVSLHFSGMHRVRTNMMTITGTQLQSILSKTIADGGGTNSTYIHREQASSFIAKYLTNVKKLIYIEDSNANTSIITHGLQEQLGTLFQESMTNAKEVHIKANAFGQVWQAYDLDPDRITREIGQIFTFNKSETEKRNSSENYFSVNPLRDCSLPVRTPLYTRIRTVFISCPDNSNQNEQSSKNREYGNTTHDVVSATDIKNAAALAAIDGSWQGVKFIPKSFRVFRLIDVVDRLQVAVIAKQLLAEKATGAVIRRVSASASLSNALNIFSSLNNETLYAALENITILASLNLTSDSSATESQTSNTSIPNENFLTGEIKLYAGSSPPSPSWLLCNGSIVSRSAYPRLFSVIGTRYGQGTNSETFRLPDLRGRVPIGVDPEQTRLINATDLGNEGGRSSHTLTIDQLPTHQHNSGSFETSSAGYHNHHVHDPGHNHGGFTSTYAVSSSSRTNYGEHYYQTNGYRQWQSFTIPSAVTQISLKSSGNHTHEITGQTGSIGQNQSFSILPPFQIFNYIIYSD